MIPCLRTVDSLCSTDASWRCLCRLWHFWGNIQRHNRTLVMLVPHRSQLPTSGGLDELSASWHLNPKQDTSYKVTGALIIDADDGCPLNNEETCNVVVKTWVAWRQLWWVNSCHRDVWTLWTRLPTAWGSWCASTTLSYETWSVPQKSAVRSVQWRGAMRSTVLSSPCFSRLSFLLFPPILHPPFLYSSSHSLPSLRTPSSSSGTLCLSWLRPSNLHTQPPEERQTKKHGTVHCLSSVEGIATCLLSFVRLERKEIQTMKLL